ncbi:unnamed protein product [Phytomonas sp. Hart1]|nr:unnamed protein product [Phytomonas sp. Hart1]|eukprot:CCW71324.1 unnamed protein product [Phytomonas sp. isolate Hart1]
MFFICLRKENNDLITRCVLAAKATIADLLDIARAQLNIHATVGIELRCRGARWTAASHGNRQLGMLGLPTTGTAEDPLEVMALPMPPPEALALAPGLPIEEANRRIHELFARASPTRNPQQQELDETLAKMIEFAPEHLIPVEMLFIRCNINDVPLIAFVDTGAAVSILKTAAAEKCELMHLLDRRFSGMVQGVGTQKCLGAMHMVPVNVSGLFIPFSFRILDEMMFDIIIGLDQLRSHQAGIDLQKGVLRLSAHEIPFLHEWEVSQLNAPKQSAHASPDGIPDRTDEKKAPPQPNYPENATTAGEDEKRESTTASGGPGTHEPQQIHPGLCEDHPNQFESREAKAERPNPPAGLNNGGEEVFAPAPRSYTPFQQDMAQKLMEFTGLLNLDKAYELLGATEWDLDAAAAMSYESEGGES